MRKLWSVLFLLMNVTAFAASFDCAKATTRQEKAICASPKLSAADDQLAAAYKAALAQTPAEMSIGVRDDQRAWVRGVAGRCPALGKTAVADLSECLNTDYEARTKQLMGLVVHQGDVTFVWRSVSVSAKDTVAPGDPVCALEMIPGSSTLTAFWPQASSDAPAWKAWNLALEAAARRVEQSDKKVPVATWEQAQGGSQDSDSEVTVTLRSVGKQVVTASIEDFQMGHCAAHPNGSAPQFNWLLAEQRELQAKDVFRAGSGWEQALVKGCRDVLIPQIRKNGGKVEGDNVLKALRAIVADPHNWQMDAKGLSIIFENSEDLSHAEIPDPITIPWAALKPFFQTSFTQPQ